MQTFHNNEKKYRVTTKKLFDAIIRLNQEQQTQVLIYVDELLFKQHSLTINKRKSDRKLCDISINYASKNRIYSDKITDISKNGLFIETKGYLKIGEEVALCFNLPGYDRPFKFKGKIVRSNQRGYGIEYKEIKPYIAEMLASLINRIIE